MVDSQTQNVNPEEIIDRLNIQAEYEALGVRTTGKPAADGWLPCHAIGRADRNASAAINLQTGRYKDHGGEGENLSLFDAAVKIGRFRTWMQARNYFRTKAGVVDGAGSHHTNGDGKKVYATSADALAAYKHYLGEPSTWFEYLDASGVCVGIVYRWDTASGKEIRPVSRVADGWICGGMPEPRPLYQQQDVVKASTVYIDEGEKAANASRDIGLTATTSANGAKSPRKTDWSPLAGKTVIIRPDNDAAGETYAKTVAGLLAKLDPAPVVKILRLPDLPPKGDAYDYITKRKSEGATVDEIRNEIVHMAQYAGVVKADAEAANEEALAALVEGPMRHVVTNGVIVEEEQEDGSTKERLVALSMAEIIERTDNQTSNGIRRVDTAVFVHDPTHGIGWLEKPQSLFGWLARTVGKVTWYGGPAFVQQGQLFAEYQRTAPRFVSVESLPHEPPMQGHYYACQEIKPGDGKALKWLLHRFNPATAIDADLILAAMMTPLWGGPPGCRPCYVITSDDGRGAGKSTLAELVGAVYDGVLQFSHLEDVATIKTRLLSPEALTRRVALIDNIKSKKFSWGELEAMITASTIGGRRLYVGEATRPNSLTWFLTLNGAALSCDMAQRSIIIKVSRPARSATWYEETTGYIREHRRAILGDLVAALRGPVTPLRDFTRWATWERDVLQRLPEPSDAQKVILERQQAVDVDEEESSLLEDYFADQLRRLGYDVDGERVFVPSQVSARWYGWATNQPSIPVISASRQLNQMATERRLRRISISTGRSWGRGFIWTGANWAGAHTSVDLQERIREHQHKDGKDR